MCKWKDIKSDTKGLMKGCAILAILLIGLIYCFVNYSHIPLPFPELVASHPHQHMNTAKHDSSISISLLTTVMFVAIWFSGITFSTFTRALAESLRDHIKDNESVKKE